MVVAAIVFIVSLLCIALLFALKRWEVARGSVFAPEMRTRGDARALEFKALLERARIWVEGLPPVLLVRARQGLHLGALSAAAAARYVERELHRLAEMVSHKRNFEKRESHNEFLKQMDEAKSNTGLDTSGDNGQNS